MSVLLKNGLVVTSTGSSVADVFVDGEKIKTIGTGLSVKADETVDASGKYILPGAIDPHTHIDMPFMGTTSSDDWKTGSMAAACGGTTTIIDFSLQNKGEMLRDAVERQKGKASGKSVVDFSIHPGVTDARPEVIEEVKKAIHEYGTPSFKIFLFYDFRVDDYTMIRLLEETKKHGGLVQVHAESFDMIRRLNEQFAADGEACARSTTPGRTPLLRRKRRWTGRRRPWSSPAAASTSSTFPPAGACGGSRRRGTGASASMRRPARSTSP